MDELNKLEVLLKENHIRYARKNSDQILVSANLKRRLSFVCRFGSYGYEQGLIEMWDFDNQHQPEGWLTAEECQRRIAKILNLK